MSEITCLKDNCPMKSECRIEFDHINQRLNEGSSKFGDHGERLRASEVQVAKLSEAMKSQIDAINKLTEALSRQSALLIGVGLTFMGTLFGFFIWFVQNSKG